MLKENLRGLAPYLLALGLDFYLLPIWAQNTGTMLMLLLCVIPFIAFATGVICGARRGFRPLLPAAALLLFMPTLFIYYNSSAWVYAPAYALIVLAGNALGRLFYGKR